MEEDENTCQRSSQRYCGRTRAVICTKTGKRRICLYWGRHRMAERVEELFHTMKRRIS